MPGAMPPLPTVAPDVPPPAGRLFAVDPPEAVPFEDDPDDPGRLVAVDPVLDDDAVGVLPPVELDPEAELPEEELPDVELPEEALPEEVELPRGTAWSPDEPAEDEPDDELPEEAVVSRGTAWPDEVEPAEPAEPPRCIGWAKTKAGVANAKATVRLSTTRVD
jgi:hypothetical protein